MTVHGLNARITPVKVIGPNGLSSNRKMPPELKARVHIDALPYIGPVLKVDRKAESFWKTKERLDREDAYRENLQVLQNSTPGRILEPTSTRVFSQSSNATQTGANVLPSPTEDIYPQPRSTNPSNRYDDDYGGGRGGIAFLDNSFNLSVVNPKKLHEIGNKATSSTGTETERVFSSSISTSTDPIMVDPPKKKSTRETGSDAYDDGYMATDPPQQQIVHNYNNNMQILNEHNIHNHNNLMLNQFSTVNNHNTVNLLNQTLNNLNYMNLQYGQTGPNGDAQPSGYGPAVQPAIPYRPDVLLLTGPQNQAPNFLEGPPERLAIEPRRYNDEDDDLTPVRYEPPLLLDGNDRKGKGKAKEYGNLQTVVFNKPKGGKAPKPKKSSQFLSFHGVRLKDRPNVPSQYLEPVPLLVPDVLPKPHVTHDSGTTQQHRNVLVAPPRAATVTGKRKMDDLEGRDALDERVIRKWAKKDYAPTARIEQKIKLPKIAPSFGINDALPTMTGKRIRDDYDEGRPSIKKRKIEHDVSPPKKIRPPKSFKVVRPPPKRNPRSMRNIPSPKYLPIPVMA
ncbi:MAG: hypothetical protein JWO77_3900 [Ilumatobacteraceae bacterium]|nr:hypothetical protein [Ilumatobacteraceae bacterium]